jgi:hypothetical protein
MSNVSGFFKVLLVFAVLPAVFCVGALFLGKGGGDELFQPLTEAEKNDIVATGIAKGWIEANTATQEPVLGPSATPTAYAPAAASSGQGVLAKSLEGRDELGQPRVTLFRYEAEETAQTYQVSQGTWLLLEFELEGHPGWYGVTYLGQKGFVRMGEIDLPDGIYTQEDVHKIIPWGTWPQP